MNNFQEQGEEQQGHTDRKGIDEEVEKGGSLCGKGSVNGSGSGNKRSSEYFPHNHGSAGFIADETAAGHRNDNSRSSTAGLNENSQECTENCRRKAPGKDRVL